MEFLRKMEEGILRSTCNILFAMRCLKCSVNRHSARAAARGAGKRK